MKLKTTDIVEAAGRIIIESGTDSLSIEELAGEIGINTSLLDSYFEKDDDILMLLLKSLENDIKQLIIETRTVDRSPEEDLQLLFQNMHELLKRKPYYLSIIFSTEVKEKNTGLQNALLRIKISVKTYLLEVINNGKKETVFKTKRTSRSLVNNILGSFRSFMNEQRLTTKMVKDLEILKDIKD
jgi:AcrR family transcriptional regulator